MNNDQQKEQLMELFPKLTEEKAEYLSSLGEDINVLITRVLDNNIDPLQLEVKDLDLNRHSKIYSKKEFYFPEIFEQYFPEVNVEKTRIKSRALFEEVKNLREKARIYPICASEYNSEADRISEQAKNLDRKAVITLVRKTLESRGAIDVHGLYVKECLMVLDDLYLKNKFAKISIATGQKYNSSKLRPNVEEWLISHGFIVYDDGPVVSGIKKFF